MYILFLYPFRSAGHQSRYRRIESQARIDNLPVRLSYKGTNYGWKVNLQLLKNYKDVNKHVEWGIWLSDGTCRFRSVKTFLDWNINLPRNTSLKCNGDEFHSSYSQTINIRKWGDFSLRYCRTTVLLFFTGVNYWGPVQATYPAIFESATVSFRIHKFPLRRVAFSVRMSTCIPW